MRIASQNYHTKPSNTPRPRRNVNLTTVTTPASNEETKIAIDSLLSLGSDMIPEDDITTENASLVPIVSNTTVNNKTTPGRNEEPDNDTQIQPDPPTPAPAPPLFHMW